MQAELQDALHWSRSNLSQHNLARDKLMTLSMTAALHCVQLTCSLLSESMERGERGISGPSIYDVRAEGGEGVVEKQTK